jgi:feruloyl esterase
MQIQSAEVVDEQPAPYCDVKGYVSPSVGFELRLPTTRWTQRFLQLGCGALCGVVQIRPPIGTAIVLQQNTLFQRGELALAATDTGHCTGNFFDGTWAAADPQLRIDFAYRGVHVTAVAATALMQAYYGQKPRYSYFSGCSEGGREAAMESQRYPEDFNGILAGCPSINILTQITLYHAWNSRSNSDANGHLILTADKLPILHAAALAACDAQDGLKDGLISEPESCHFDPVVTQCQAGQDPATCLTPAQVHAAQLIYQGAHDEKGQPLVVTGPLPGSELQWNEYVTMAPGAAETVSTLLATFASKYLAFPENRPLEYTLADFRFDGSTFRGLAAMHAIYDALDPDLSHFAAAGDKIIFWHGWADGSIPPVNTIAYYNAVQKQMGADRTKQFALLYLFPGGYHCNRVAPIVCDLLSAIMGWVEEGVVPNRLLSWYFAPGTVQLGAPADISKAVRTRPVYPYPQAARYSGKGSIDDARNFEAGMPRTTEPPINWIGATTFFKPDYEQWCGWSGLSFTCGPGRK